MALAMTICFDFLHFSEKVSIFVTQSAGLQTYRKCFSESWIENVEVFIREGERTALISCIYAVGMLYANVLLYTSVGHAAFILLKVIPQPSIQ